MLKKRQARVYRQKRVRRKIHGTSERPRVSVFKSLQHLSAQAIDDGAGKTLLGISTLSKEFKGDGGNVKGAEALGDLFAKKAKLKKISRVIFDRGGFIYHGRVKAFAEALRKGGLEF